MSGGEKDGGTGEREQPREDRGRVIPFAPRRPTTPHRPPPHPPEPPSAA